MIRPPHPAVAELYRQASTPSRLLSRLKTNDELLARIEVEPVAGGEGGDELLVRLTRGLQLGEVLDPVLARLETTAATGEHQHIASRPHSMPADASADVRPPSMIPPPDRARPRAGRTESSTERPRHRAAAVPGVRPTTSRAALPNQRPLARPVSSFPQQPSNPATQQPSPAEPPNPESRQPRNPATQKPTTTQPPDPLPFPAAATPPRRRANNSIPLPLPDAAAAQEALVKRALRRGVVDALHQPVGSDVPPRVAVMLQHSAAAPPQPAPPEAPLHRLAATVDRLEHGESRRVAPPSSVAHAADDRVTVVPVAALSRETQPLSPPVGGFRGLVALVEAQRPRSAAPPPVEKIAPPAAPPTLDDAALTARISEILRRDAERHGIDLTGVEP